MKRLVGLAFVASALVLAAPLAASASPPAGAQRSSYIVVLAGPADLPGVAAAAQSAGGTVGYEYHNVFTGFSAALPAAAAYALAHNPRVVSIEPDGVVTATATSTQFPTPSWGLDRVDQHALAPDNSYSYTTTGSGVKAYIVDTGIRTSHNDFGGRAISGYTAINDGQGTSDCNGHGTHVSGTVGGSTFGIAKAVTLVAVRVLDCNGSGSWAGVVAGIDWAIGDHATNTSAVLNMSLGGGASSSVDAAVQSATDDGITVVVAAGNSNKSACNYSPARAASAITVGATESNDARASYSNYGTCVDLFAPGSSITSDWNTSNSATNTISGTSMASPHTTGVAARYLESNAGASPATVAAALRNAATPGVVTSAGSGSPNRLLWADPGSGGPQATRPNPPTAVAATAGNASALVSWTPPANNGGSSITSYTVTSSPGSLTCGTLGNTSCTVTGLTNNQPYTFTVVATNAIGSSDPSSPSSAVTPNPPPPGPAFTLTATGTKVKGDKQVALTWSPTGSPVTVDIRRDGGVVVTVPNSGSYNESLGKGSGTYTYQVCNVGSTTICSNPATVVF